MQGGVQAAAPWNHILDAMEAEGCSFNPSSTRHILSDAVDEGFILLFPARRLFCYKGELETGGSAAAAVKLARCGILCASGGDGRVERVLYLRWNTNC